MSTANSKTLEIKSNLQEVAVVGLCSRKLAESLSFTETEVYEIELAVVEAVTNCIEHAYSSEEGNRVFVHFETNPNAFIVVIEDFGRFWENFKDLKQNDSTFDFNPENIEDLPEGGMGVALLFKLMDEVNYERKDNKNSLTLRKLLRPTVK